MAIPIDPHLPPVTPPTPPRVAEPSDARLPIREHEEQARRKKDDDDKKETMLPDDSYDQSVLGVRSLIDFLKNFVQGQGVASRPGVSTAQAQTPSDPVSIAPSSHAPAPSPLAGASARAASAYRHSAEAAHPTGAHNSGPSAGSGGSSVAPVDLLQNAEIRQIYDVIALLEALEKRGVQGIRLERAETFVTAIETAARQELVNTK